MTYQEFAFVFPCGGESLVGIVAMPQSPTPIGVLVIVGGPQYRIGSHRQFVQLSRYLSFGGVPCMRFDCRGMGDSGGVMRTFEEVLPDTRAAIDAFVERFPHVRRIVLWGLCDGATAAAFYASTDPRIAGLVLLNPWVRTQESEATTYLRHYYTKRLFEKDFWRKVLRGRFRVGESARSLATLISSARRQDDSAAGLSPSLATQDRSVPLPLRMAMALKRFSGRVLVILSGNDYTAKEFRDVACGSEAWRSAVSREDFRWELLPEADHTFSTAAWSERVAMLTLDWTLAFA
jgi:exosortase A-associated hydrolase 1